MSDPKIIEWIHCCVVATAGACVTSSKASGSHVASLCSFESRSGPAAVSVLIEAAGVEVQPTYPKA